MTDTKQDAPEVRVAPERVLAALEALGWPDDRGEQYTEEAGVMPAEAHYRLAEEVIRATDKAGHQQQALQNKVDSLVREVRRLQHADRRAVRYALEKDREVAEVDAKLSARDAEIARLNAREAATRVQLHDANGDVEDLRSRLKATSDACNDAENRLHTMTEVARGNKRHVAVLTGLIERVARLTVDGEGLPKDPALVLYVGDLRSAIEAPVRVPGQPGDRVEDGGVMGTLVRCEKCGGDGLLHKPDHLPPTAEPQESPEP